MTVSGGQETRSNGAKRRANSFAAVTTTSVNFSHETRDQSSEKRLEDTERSVSTLVLKQVPDYFFVSSVPTMPKILYDL